MNQDSQPGVLIMHGDLSPSIDVSDIGDPAYVVAVDGGLSHVRRLGFTPSIVVGDMDSATASDLEWATESGAEVQVSPTDKDQTDLELGLAHITTRCSRIVVLGGEGGTAGHLFGNFLTLASTTWARTVIEWRLAHATVRVVHPGDWRTVSDRAGERVSLLPIHGAACEVTTTGLQWPLFNAILQPGESRGISNRTIAPPATVRIERGTLVAITEDPV
ncbi:MAG: thiamine diphosphokinase [Actinobacteria bacterium]|nr:thiamine diphosphokinase [Actinomycetota bacterium]